MNLWAFILLDLLPLLAAWTIIILFFAGVEWLVRKVIKR